MVDDDIWEIIFIFLGENSSPFGIASRIKIVIWDGTMVRRRVCEKQMETKLALQILIVGLDKKG
jgi:hypothetical protein